MRQRRYLSGIFSLVLVLGLFALLPMAVLAGDAGNAFHVAHTRAEKSLDSILTEVSSQESLVPALLGRGSLTRSEQWQVVAFFTQELVAAWRQKERRSVEENCSGHYVNGEVCGLDYDPLFCAQDQPENGFLFRTESMADTDAIVSVQWKGHRQNSVAAKYRMVKFKETWKISGIFCPFGHGS